VCDLFCWDRNMRTSIVVALVAVAALCAAESTIYDFLKGDWNIFVYKTPFAVAELPEDIESNHYTFTARNGTTSILDGVVATEDGNEQFQVRLSGPFVGEYLLVKSDDAAAEKKKDEEAAPEVGEDMGLKPTENTVEEKEEDEEDNDDAELDLQSLFKFNFVNLTEGHYVSQGAWGENGAYQAVISTGAKPSFTMTIYKIVDGKASEYTTILAKKVLPRPEPSFMQKYGMLIMMGTMLLMNFAKSPSMAGGAAPAGGDAGAAAPAAAPAAAAPASQTTRAEAINAQRL